MKPRSGRRAGGAAGWTLFVLFIANVFNVGDRTLLGVVTEPVRSEIGLTDTEISLASGFLFVLFNLVAGLFVARLIDVGNRKRILALGIAGWSIATALTGLAQDFGTLALARIGVGVGEATAFPAAMSLIPDLFRPESRGKAIAVFQSSGMVGVVSGTMLAGILAASLGWRPMFMVCGAAGVILSAVTLLTVREPPRNIVRDSNGPYFPELVAACTRIVSTPGFVPLALAFGTSGMVGAVLGAWGPAFLQRSHGVPLAQVGLIIGPAVGIAGILGTLLSGVLADWLVRRRGVLIDMLRLPLVALPLAAPAAAGFAAASSLLLTMTSAFAMNFLLACAVPPCVNYAITVAGPGDRAVASTMMLAATGLLGGALGPFTVGVLSDAFSARFGTESLRYGIAAIAATPLVAAAFLLLAIRLSSARTDGLQSA
ncbi:MAG: MFS transporter [Novosphingobium sp.]|nr:MFS transporter [Novosphingobium sp.]